MSKIKANLKSGGYLVCVDWFSKQDSAWKIAPKKFKKLHTILNIKKGDLKDRDNSFCISKYFRRDI